ncbi:MAG: hypothetical protein U9N86_17255, partial [Bacteroidota bacterium]|nr:hypothetical protein [Bacteroidota bacterium]
MINTTITTFSQTNKLRFFLFGLIISISACTESDLQENTRVYNDLPFIQDYAEQFELITSQAVPELLEVTCDRNKNIKVLSAEGLLQPWEKKLAADQLYRPISDMKIISITSFKNQFVYLTDKAILSNAWAGKFYIKHNIDSCSHFVLGDDFLVMVAAREKLAFFADSELVWEESLNDFEPIELLYNSNQRHFVILSKSGVYTFNIVDKQLIMRFNAESITSMALVAEKSLLVIGTEDGIISLDSESFKEMSPLNTKLPNTNISCITEINGKLWFGSSKGAFSLRDDGKYDYYASKRWLVDDHVIDISAGPDNSVLFLTETGLSKIVFTKMTLAEKAEYFQEVQ